VIRRQDEHQRILVLCAQNVCGGGDGGGSVPGDRFQNDVARLDADFAKLLGNEKPVFLVTDHEGRGKNTGVGYATSRFLQQALIGNKFEKLLGIGSARLGPQARAGSS
jgi:hypothetical protein